MAERVKKGAKKGVKRATVNNPNSRTPKVAASTWSCPRSICGFRNTESGVLSLDSGGGQDVAGFEDNAQPHDAPLPREPRGYIRMVVMDGKTIPHQKCALDQCESPLVNYKNGRFCEMHLNLQGKCGIIPCGLPVRQVGALTYATDSHIQWECQYTARFFRLTFPGVRRVIRQQPGSADSQHANGHGSTLRVSLPALGDTPGNQVVDTFKDKYTCCLQTVQLTCGYPNGWVSKHTPSFSKFIVDAWHYICHRATDMLCRVWCNPAPKNGSQKRSKSHRGHRSWPEEVDDAVKVQGKWRAS
ncbi:hypothetical protein C8R45DRAFT_1166301 [Mycena sanguinolenta]|nr:hypothetical protein C8R45DRAFT_1166301 [Mycena sanguinolenta]